MKKYVLTFAFVVFGIAASKAQAGNTQISKLYQNYIAVKSALASDDDKKTTATANEFLKTMNSINAKTIEVSKINTLKASAKNIASAKSIAEQRKSFYALSDEMIAIANENKLSDKTIFVQYCPMAKGSWLSNEKQIVNPYYGSSMLSCGTVKSEIKK